jgi:23S rRNA pseudouridine1911/1915/1917 synthase
LSIELLYEDNHLLIAVKPPNVPIQGDISGAPDFLTLLKEDIKIRFNKPGNVFLGLVHRLDRPVGGVMVFAKTSKAASRLSEQIRNHETEKIYLCVVQGCPEALKGRLADNLLKNKATNVVSVVKQGTTGAKQAILDYEVLNVAQGLSLVKVRLHTGRSHQIRVQMLHNGTPLVGDTKYGYQGDKGQMLALWSHQIGINHPTTKERMLFTSSPPNQYPWNLF